MSLLEARGLTAKIVDGSSFRHLLIERNLGVAAPRLHVYIEGDGTPWLTPILPASDPTPTRALALELALLDSGAVIYLGRPCYFGVRDNACNVLTWTHERYSEAVVTSMAAALTTVARDRGYRRLVLIGHSGGGTLAVLLAERLAQVERVITIGANIDLAAWTRRHRFSPLIGSLDPATRTPAPQARETHYVGARDGNVPPSLVRNAVAQRGVGEVIEMTRYDHVCCWVELWPDVLARLGEEVRIPAAPKLLMQKKFQ